MIDCPLQGGRADAKGLLQLPPPVKLVFEPGFGHYEIFGVYARFRDRAFPCEEVATTQLCGNSTTPGATNASGGGWARLDAYTLKRIFRDHTL